jgi:hypothetical protein
LHFDPQIADAVVRLHRRGELAARDEPNPVAP